MPHSHFVHNLKVVFILMPRPLERQERTRLQDTWSQPQMPSSDISRMHLSGQQTLAGRLRDHVVSVRDSVDSH